MTGDGFPHGLHPRIVEGGRYKLGERWLEAVPINGGPAGRLSLFFAESLFEQTDGDLAQGPPLACGFSLHLAVEFIWN